MLDFYRAVSECDPGKKNMTAVALDGPGFGQRALFSEGRLVWESEEGGFFSENREELLEAAEHMDINQVIIGGSEPGQPERAGCGKGNQGVSGLAWTGTGAGDLRRRPCVHTCDPDRPDDGV